MSAFENHDGQIGENEPVAKKSSPLRARGRFSSMTAHNGRTGVVQFIDRSDAGNAYAMVNFERSLEGHNDTKAIPLSAFPNAYVQTNDSVTVYVGEDREGDRRNVARRVLEAIGVLKESAKIHAVINVHASAQSPMHDPALEQRGPSERRGLMTRILYGLERVVSHVVDGLAAVSKAALRAPHVVAQLASTLFPEPATKLVQSSDVSVTAQSAPDVRAKPAPSILLESATKLRHDPSVSVAEGKGIGVTGSGAPDVYETPIIKKPQRIAGISGPMQIRVSNTNVAREHAVEHDMPKPQRATLVRQPQPQRAVIQEPMRIAIEGGEKAQQYSVRNIPQVARRGLWATEAGKEITPQARTKAARSKADVRAIAVEQARKHGQTEKTQEQGKGR